MPDESGMVKRGLLLLGMVGILAVAVLLILFRNRAPATPKVETPPEVLIGALIAPGAGFPMSINWVALQALGANLPSAPGWEIRYTATRVLAHRGSPKTPLPILCEMLDADQQQRNFRSRLPDGRLIADEAAAYHEILIALKAVGEWRKKSTSVMADHPEMVKLRAAIEKLTGSPNNVVRARAREVMLTMDPRT
ncbi:MAG: hypothetical protein FJ271_21750 [Planctomycetes bacterium]|nr:hypothetical protein [Planctomycetota bacterium]